MSLGKTYTNKEMVTSVMVSSNREVGIRSYGVFTHWAHSIHDKKTTYANSFASNPKASMLNYDYH